jgi:ATP-dependent DNA helicase RecG
MMSVPQLEALLARGETLETEFKSDTQKMSDSEIYEEIVALANSSGGVLVIGVRDDGSVAGAKPRHGKTTDVLKLQSAIFNNTVPNINTRVSWILYQNTHLLAIEVNSYPEPCATATGKALRRAIGPDGKPQTVPFYPRDQRSRRIDLGLFDFSVQTIEPVAFDDLNPLEFERLRQVISSLHGDKSLLELSDEEIAKALRLIESHGHKLIPNVAGLLLLGREEILLQLLPTHEVYFQVLDAQENVRVNDSLHWPLLRVIQELEARFEARNEEGEIQVGMFRFPVPDYSKEAFREAVNNAILHRDYNQLGATYIQWHPEYLFISNPGGFPEGITVDNILVHEPKPRNPRLAEAFRRVGLVEQTGRGVDKIYRGQLRYGRPIPDYTRSDSTGVRVVLQGGKPSMEFAAFVYERERQGDLLTLDELIVLNELFFQRRIDSSVAAKLIQKGVAQARAVLEHLLERGLVEARPAGRGRAYILAAWLYQRFSMEAAYVRMKGFEPHQHEQMILDYVKKHGRINRSQVADLCQVSLYQSSRLLRHLAAKHSQFKKIGETKGTYYTWID